MVAVVMPGGGSRGAYEAGALSVILPALAARGERVSIWCGTSVGAINAATLASLAHLPPEEAAAGLVERWRSMRKGDVIRSVLGPRLPLTAARLAAEALGVPGVRTASVLDAAPLRSSLERWVDWDDLHRNVRTGEVAAVCVVATALGAGRPVAFVHARRRTPLPVSPRLRYVRAALRAEHVRASAAIPMLFPPVEVEMPRSAAGSYIDGGVRLNHPLKPALALGAGKVVLIGFEPFDDRVPHVSGEGEPGIADVLANVLDGLLVDHVVDDLHRLVAINAFLVDAPAAAVTPAARRYRRARGHEPYRRISYALVSPERRGELGEVALRILHERYGGWRALRDLDYGALASLPGTAGPTRGELLSFLLFDERFVEALIAAGRADAQRWLERHPKLWCADATHDLGTIDPGQLEAAREETALSEWRERRRPVPR